jgi:hypothetical protein
MMQWANAIHISVTAIVFATIAFCVLRAIHIFWEGLRGFRAAEHLCADSAVRAEPQLSAARAIAEVRWTS